MSVIDSNAGKVLKKSRKTIGFLINQLHDRYQGMLCPGIFDGAAKRDYNLIAFVGKSLESPSAFDNQENVVYKLADENNIDGLLIITGAIGNYLSPEKLKSFCYKYRSIPTVCVSTPVEGIPSVWLENRSGTRDIVNHFIKFHNYSKIAYIRGPSNNPEAELRFEVFKEVLIENNIPFDPDLVYEGNFVLSSGIEGVKAFLDERKLQFEALLSANDEMLIGAYREFSRRKIRIPEDVALGGFDNINETRIMDPQITTVIQPLYEEGLKAFEILADTIEGKSVPELSTFPSRLVIRQSCGCDARNAVSNNEEKPAYRFFEKAASEQSEIINDGMRKSILDELNDDIELQYNYPKEFMEYKGLFEIYLNQFIKSLKSPDVMNSFLDDFSGLMVNAQEKNTNLDFFRIFLSKLYQSVYPFFPHSGDLVFKAYSLYNSALSILLNSISKYDQNMLVLSNDANWAMLNVTKTLSTTFNLDNLRYVIIKLLPTLDINFCFIALYERGTAETKIPSSRSGVFIYYDTDNQNYDYNNELIFDTIQLIPDKLKNKDKILNLAVFPLVTENDHFGYIVFDHKNIRNPIMIETLQAHISASLKGALLIETVNKQSLDLLSQKDELSRSLEKLRKIMGGFINSMSLLVETRDPYTAGHQARVANLARAIASEMGLSKDQIEGIRVSGVLHDLGKLYVPSQILNKPGRLLDVELTLIKLHPQIGYNILKAVDFSWPIADIILQHHERIDGSGYPLGLKADQILIEAKIISIADVVEAIASHRPYRPSLGIDAALEEIVKNRGIYYDPEAVDCCVRLFKEKGFSFEDLTSSFQYPQTSK